MQLLINVLVAGDGHMNTLLCMQVKLVRLRSVLHTDVRETYLHVSKVGVHRLEGTILLYMNNTAVPYTTQQAGAKNNIASCLVQL